MKRSVRLILLLFLAVATYLTAPRLADADICFAGTDCTTASWVGMRCCWSEPDPRIWVGCRTVCRDYDCVISNGVTLCPDIQMNGEP